MGITLHTHNLCTGSSVWAYNVERDEYRELVYERPKSNNVPIQQTVYPGEYLSTRCIYNLTTIDHDIGLEREEMCRMVFRYYTDQPADFKFAHCQDTMDNAMSEKLMNDLPAKSRIPYAIFTEYSN